MRARRLVPIALASCLAVAASAACSGDDDAASPTTSGGGPAATATTTSGPTGGEGGSTTSTAATGGPSSSSTAEPGTTPTTGPGAPASGGCPGLAALPADAQGSGARRADVDDDGRDDLVTTYSVGATPGPGDWHLRVELEAGGGAEYTLAEDPAPAPFQVVGTAYVGSNVDPGAGGRRPAIFAWVDSGASAKVVALYRLDGCAIVPMTSPNGGPANFVAGGSIGHQEGMRCEGVAGTSLLVEVLSEAADGGGFAVTERAYTREANALQVYGQPSMTNSAGPPPEAGKINCDDVSLD